MLAKRLQSDLHIDDKFALPKKVLWRFDIPELISFCIKQNFYLINDFYETLFHFVTKLVRSLENLSTTIVYNVVNYPVVMGVIQTN